MMMQRFPFPNLRDFHFVTRPSTHPEACVQSIREEFRTHLETLYSHLHLAPPYHSIEKAIQLLANTLRTKPPHFHNSLKTDANFKWNFFREIYLSSGLNRKHRGIISNFMKSQSSRNMPDDTFQLLRNHPNFPEAWGKPNEQTSNSA